MESTDEAGRQVPEPLAEPTPTPATAISDRLAAVEPEPPRSAAARVDGRRVVVTWQPGRSPDGRVTYRVTRRTGHGGTAGETAVGEVSGTQVVDDRLPVGNEASYAVVAVLGGRGESAAVVSRPVMITPDVGDLRVWADEASVSGSWRAPPEAVRVEVLRGEGGPPRGPGDGVPVEHDGTGFVDTSVRPDAEYHYRVRAVYVTSRGLARGSSGPSGDACSPVEDQALRDHLGRRERLPPVFEANGRRPKAVCPECSGTTDRKVCAVCHARMPVNFGRTRGRTIALVGARDAGKTVFMTVLIHELRNRVGNRFDASVGGSDDHTRHRFGPDYESPLYEQGRLLQGTRRAAGAARAPLLFRYTGQRRGLTGPRPRHTLLSFFDTAGEDLNDEESVETDLRYLNNADGVIVLLDPLQMDGARRLAAPGTRLPAPEGPENRPIHMLERVTDLLMRREGTPNRLIRVPIAVCLTKIDALRGEMDEGSPLHRPQSGDPFFDESDSQDVHAQIQQLLYRWDGAGIDHHVRDHYRNARYFGVSALGGTPSHDNRVQGGVRPYRVADPFLWMLAEFGVVPSRGAPPASRAFRALRSLL